MGKKKELTPKPKLFRLHDHPSSRLRVDNYFVKDPLIGRILDQLEKREIVKQRRARPWRLIPKSESAA